MRPRGIGVADENVDKFLAGMGLSRAEVERLYDPVLGEVAFLSLGGSVPAGYSTPSSDLDLHAITETAGAFTSSVAHDLGMLIDIVAETRAGLHSKLEALDGWAARPLSTTPAVQLKEREMSLWMLGRLSLSSTIKGDDEVQRAIRERGPALVDASRCYWIERAWRMHRLAGLLADRPWPQAVACEVEAVLSALKAVAAAAGFVYQEKKFLALELEQIDDTKGLLDHYRAALRAPSAEADVPRWRAEAAGALEGIIGPCPPARVGLTWAPGVVIRPLRAESIVTMWDLHGVRIKGPVPAVGELVWTGSLTDDPPGSLQELLTIGMLHMEVVLDG